MNYVLKKDHKLKQGAKLKRQEKLEKKRKMLKRISITFMIAFLVVLIWIIFFKNRSYNHTFENDSLSFDYDSTWKVSKNETNSISLTHKTDSIIDINISILNSNYTNSSIEQVVDEVKYDIKNQKSDYKLLKEEKQNITQNNYESYKMLYENKDNQSLIIVLKKGTTLIVINYISKDKYFDIVLDSYQGILSSLTIK